MNKALLRQALACLRSIDKAVGAELLLHVNGIHASLADLAHTAIDGLQAAIDAPEPEPVATIIFSYEVDEYGKVVSLRAIDYEQDVIDALPVDAKLFTEPPDTAALRAELERVKGDTEKWKRSYIGATNHWLYERGQGGCEPDAEQIAWAEALQKDAERYRWLRQGERYTAIVPSPTEKNPKAKITILVAPNPQPAYAECLDVAIDAAIAAQGDKA